MAVGVTGCEHPTCSLTLEPVVLHGQGVNQLRFLRLMACWKLASSCNLRAGQVSCETLTLLNFRQGAEVRACCATCTFSAEGPTCQLSQPSSHCTSTCFAVTGLKLTSCASAVPNLRPRSCLAALFLLFDQNVPKSVWLLMWTTVVGPEYGGQPHSCREEYYSLSCTISAHSKVFSALSMLNAKTTPPSSPKIPRELWRPLDLRSSSSI